MKDLYWGLFLFVIIVVVLINPFKMNLREYYGGRGGYGRRGSGYYGGSGGWGGINHLNYGYDEDYYYVLPRYFPFPLGY